MVRDGGKGSATAIYPQISGFWTWDVQRDRVYGDANLSEYFCLTQDEFLHGAPIKRIFEGIIPSDRDRVAQSIELAVQEGSPFRELYSVQTRFIGIRRIMAVGRCYADKNGTPSQYPGWFVDVTGPNRIRKRAMTLAAAYVEHARDLAMLADHDLAGYLLDNVLEELESQIRRDGDELNIAHYPGK